MIGRECMVYGFVLCEHCCSHSLSSLSSSLASLASLVSLVSLVSLKVFLQTHIRANAAWSHLEILVGGLLAAAAVASVAYFR